MTKLAILFSVLLQLLLMSCEKEYSYEGGNVIRMIDTTRPPVLVNEFPDCLVCLSGTTTELWAWSFKSGNSVLCGEADTAIINQERTAFTFFGPSACAADTGIIVSIYLNTDTLKKDISNLAVSKIVFYYYDNVTASYIFRSQASSLISATITSYVHQTKIVTGTFQGYVVRSNGGSASITAGKFKMKVI